MTSLRRGGRLLASSSRFGASCRLQHRQTLCSHPVRACRGRVATTAPASQSFSTLRALRAEKESIRPQTHYDFFPTAVPDGAPPKGPFQVDLQLLKREFLRLQASTHPDRHPGEQKQRAEALSARVNEAYKTLQDPLRRAQYILSLRGIDVAEDETAKVDDAELLMDVMEARETIEEAQSESDLEEIRQQNDANLAASISTLDEAFRQDDLDTAKVEAVKLRYWTNIKQSIDDWEPGKPIVLVH